MEGISCIANKQFGANMDILPPSVDVEAPLLVEENRGTHILHFHLLTGA